MLQKGVPLSEWQFTTIVPTFKKGSHTQCSNYPPVGLTCTLCKFFKHVIKDLMLDFFYYHTQYGEPQLGFLPSRSCSALLSFLETIDQFFDVIYLDLSKAFDSISHRSLY